VSPNGSPYPTTQFSTIQNFTNTQKIVPTFGKSQIQSPIPYKHQPTQPFIPPRQQPGISYPQTQNRSTDEKLIPSWLKEALSKKKDEKSLSSGLSVYDTPFYKGTTNLGTIKPPIIEPEIQDEKEEIVDPKEEAKRFEDFLKEELKSIMTDVLTDVTNEIIKHVAKHTFHEFAKRRKVRDPQDKITKIITHESIEGLVNYNSESDQDDDKLEIVKRNHSRSPSPESVQSNKKNRI